MRIAIIAEVFLPKIDGVVGRTLNLIQELRKRGDDVVVVCPEVPQTRVSPVPLIEFPGFPCVSYPEYIIGRPDKRLIDELKAFQPDVIHFLNPFAFGFQCCDLLYRSELDVPVLFSFHTLYGEFVKQYPGLSPLSRTLWWLMRSYHNTADCNLTVSSVMAEDLIQRNFERVALWPPAVDTSLFSPARRSMEMRCRLSGNRPESPLLITVSRLAPEKNVGFLAEILRRVPEATLGIVGGGPQREELERRFAKHPVQFLGYLQGNDLAAAYASADAFVYASETETMGNVVLEAMASGLPVVAARAGGVPSLVRHGVDGCLFEPRHGGEAAQCVRELLQNRKMRDAMSAAALDSVQTRSWGHSAETVRNHYHRIIESHRSGTAGQGAVQRPAFAARLITRTLVKMFRAVDVAGRISRRGFAKISERRFHSKSIEFAHED